MARKNQKKGFEDLQMDPLHNDIATATSTPKAYAKTEAGPEEKAARLKERRTQGKKGCKAPRINVAFSQQNYDYVRIMSRIKGKTMCAFVNDCLTQYREEHPELFQVARTLIDYIDTQEEKDREKKD